MSQEGTKIKYAAVEVIRNNGKTADDIECGAVMGICRRKDDKETIIPFLAVVNSTNSIRLYNLNEYHIVTFDVLDDDIRYMTVYTDTEEDQAAAVLMIDQLVAQMAESGHLMANDAHKELIDVEKYEDMPDAVLEGKNLSDDTKKTNTSSSSSSQGYTKTSTHTSTYTKTEPTIMSVKRKGKLPSPDRLIKMRDKVMLLASGELEMPILHTPKCDLEAATKEKEEDKKKSYAT